MGFTHFTPDENGFRFSNNKFSPPLSTCKRFRGECATAELSSIGGDEPSGPVGGQVEISAPVGINGRNLPADTVTIQDA